MRTPQVPLMPPLVPIPDAEPAPRPKPERPARAAAAAAAGAGGGIVPVIQAEIAGVDWRKRGVSAAERAFKEDMVAESIARRAGAPVEEAEPRRH